MRRERTMTMPQNQAPKGLANVLHDEGIPNTIAGIGVTASAERSSLRGLVIVAAMSVIAVLLIFLTLVVGRAA